MFDSHAHYDDEKFNDDRDLLLKRLHDEGIEYIINPACNLQSCIDVINLAERYDYIYAAVGVHPHDADTCNEDTIKQLEGLAQNRKVVAIGEIGLDYHYDFSPRETQKKWFRGQIRIARSLELPLIIHDREAHEDIMRIVKEEKAYEAGGVFHCFAGSVEMARQVIEMGFYISLGGAVTFKNARKPVEVAEYIPLERLLVETDSPYMTPVPYRGKRNDSGYVSEVIKKIAEIKNTSFEEINNISTENAKKLFKIQ